MQGEDRIYVDFRDVPVGPAANPLVLPGAGFLVSDPSGQPQQTIEIRAGICGRLLQCVNRLDIQLWSNCGMIDLRLLATGYVDLKALGPDGERAHSLTVRGELKPQMVRLVAPQINRVTVSSSSELGLLSVEPDWDRFVDFREAGVPATAPNPRIEQGITFVVFDTSGSMVSLTELCSGLGWAGLAIGSRLDAVLPSQAETVEIEVLNPSGIVTVTGLDAAGVAVATATLEADAVTPQSQSITADEISRAEVSSSAHGALLLKFAYSPSGSILTTNDRVEPSIQGSSVSADGSQSALVRRGGGDSMQDVSARPATDARVSTVADPHTPAISDSRRHRLALGRGVMFVVQVVYLLVLFALAFLWITARNRLPFPAPVFFGPVPTGVLWFGALGAVLISLTGISEHANDWKNETLYWYLTRPLVGAAVGMVSVLIIQAGVLAVGIQPGQFAPNAPRYLLFYLVAFAVGYREETFRELLKRLTDLILTPATTEKPPTITDVNPKAGPLTGHTPVAITGAGFATTTDVKFGTSPAIAFKVDSDTHISATTPPADAPGNVAVTITTKNGSVSGGSFTYSAPI